MELKEITQAIATPVLVTAAALLWAGLAAGAASLLPPDEAPSTTVQAQEIHT